MRGKNDLLLIAIFRELVNPQIEGHLDHFQVAFTVLKFQLKSHSFALVVLEETANIDQ